MKLTIALIVSLFLWLNVNAQQDTILSKKEQRAIKKEQRAAKKVQKITDGKFLISPIVLPGYTPELKFAIGAGGIISWRNSKTDNTLPRSNIPFSVAISSTGALVINLRPATYWASDNFRLNSNIWYKNMPDNYWGIGYKNGFETPKSDSTTAYDRKWFQFSGDPIYRVKGDFFAGLSFDANYIKGSDASAGVLEDPNYIVYNERPFNAGIGPTFLYDSRDVSANAYKGLLLRASGTFFGPYLGGDNKYQVYLLDYRQYQSVGKKQGRVIAWQLLSRLTFGEVPYGEMSQLGTPFDLRGYTWGQYRDKSMFFCLVEYRHKFYKSDGKPSKSGFVAWVGSGTIFDLEQNSDYNAQAKWLPNFGVGYRFELQPRLNLRIDFGIGRKTIGLYFNMTEAF